jgi:hypothetical protein
MTAIRSSEEPVSSEEQSQAFIVAAAASAQRNQQQQQQGQCSSTSSRSSKRNQPVVSMTRTVRGVQRQVQNNGTTCIISRSRRLRHHHRHNEPDLTSGDTSNSCSSTRIDDDNIADFVAALDTTTTTASSRLDTIAMEKQEEEQQLLLLLQQPQQVESSMMFNNNCCSSLYADLKKRHAMSLSQSPTTPSLLRWLVPLLSLCTHCLFLYCQVLATPMWRLHLSIHVDDDAWANATTYESHYVFNTLGIPLTNHMTTNQEMTVKEFSFLASITELWNAVGTTSSSSSKLVLPRLAAILSILFSGVWPHLKLLLLQWTWFTEHLPTRRTRILHSLGTLGKWPLANVLAICVMVGVLHLDWIVDAHAVKHGLMQNFGLCLTVAQDIYGNDAPDICSAGLAPLNCHHHHSKHDHHDHHHSGHWDDWSKCQACITLVNLAMEHPDALQRTFQSVLNGVTVSGDGFAHLRVQGMRGIYAFCLAVIMSILISFMVDILDVRSHNNHDAQRQQALLADEHDETDQTEEEDEDIIFQPSNIDNMIRILDVSQNCRDDNNLGAPLLFLPPPAKASTLTDISARTRRGLRLHGSPVDDSCRRQCIRYWSLLGSTGLTFCIVVAAVWYPTFARVVTGAIPQVVGKVLGAVWHHNQPYSLYGLVQTTGAAGGFDYLLMATFGLLRRSTKSVPRL